MALNNLHSNCANGVIQYATVMIVQFSIRFWKPCLMSVPTSLSQIYSVIKWLFPENMIMPTGAKKLDNQDHSDEFRHRHHNRKAAEAQPWCENDLKNSGICFFTGWSNNSKYKLTGTVVSLQQIGLKTNPQSTADTKLVCVCDHKSDSHPDPWWTTTATRSYTQLSGKEFSGCKKTYKIKMIITYMYQ